MGLHGLLQGYLYLSAVGIATGYRLDDRGKGRNFLLSMSSRPVLGLFRSPIQWVPVAISPGLKPPGRETDHSPSSSAEDRNGGAIPPLHHMSSWHRA
jgi:hypothetical protein